MKRFFPLIAIAVIFTLPILAFAQETSTTELGEVEDFGDMISKIWSWGFVVILSLSVAMIVVGGFLYMMSSGNEEKIDQAKQIIDGSLISTGIVLFSGVIQKLLVKPTESLSPTGESLKLGQLPEAVKNATNLLLTMIGGFAVVMIILSAYQYISSGGDAEKLDRAKKSLMYSIIGLGVALSASLILNTFIGVFRK
jgi:hypothetical protein